MIYLFLENCYELHRKLKKENIDILINNAGFGDCGQFSKTSLKKELNMIDLNIKAYHILTKLFLKDFTKRNRGRILNVASIAGFMQVLIWLLTMQQSHILLI